MSNVQIPSVPPFHPLPRTQNSAAAQNSAAGLLRIMAWPDPITDDLGHDPRSTYVEMFWLPILGPTCIWLMRRLATLLEEKPQGLEMNMDELAQELGIGTSNQKGPPIKRSIMRCCDFGLVHFGDNNCLFVRQRMPQLNPRLFNRLGKRLKQAHLHWADDSVSGGS